MDPGHIGSWIRKIECWLTWELDHVALIVAEHDVTMHCLHKLAYTAGIFSAFLDK
jgi:hypothetical protein